MSVSQVKVSSFVRDKPVRALNQAKTDTIVFNQYHLFIFRTGGDLLKLETILTNAAMDGLIQPNPEYPGFALWSTISNPTGLWRGREYAFYRKGLETEPFIPFGDGITWQEQLQNGRMLIARLNFGKWKDAPVSFSVDGRTVTTPLKEACGLGVVDIDKLQFRLLKGVGSSPQDRNSLYFEVEFRDNLNPARDLAVIDVMRPAAWALPDVRGFPLRDHPLIGTEPDARFPALLTTGQFSGAATGYHGSVVRSVCKQGDWDESRVILLSIPWHYLTGVAVVNNAATADELRELMTRVEAVGGPVFLQSIARAAEAAVKSAGPVIEWAGKNLPLLKELADRIQAITEPPSLFGDTKIISMAEMTKQKQ